MDISSLVIVRPADAEAAPLKRGQFEFVINRAERKFIHRFDLLSRRELARVQTGQVYTLNSRLDLPDTSSGTLRAVPCTVQVEGMVPGDEGAAKAFLATALDTDFDFAGLAAAVLTQAVAGYGGIGLDGHFVAMMRKAADRERFLRHLSAELNVKRLAVQRVIVTPHAVDSPTQLDIQDDEHSLEIRCAGDLRTVRVGYRARLVWGTDDAHWLARLTYRGGIAGRTAGTALPMPVVVGQVQPLEAWLRKLLAAALSQYNWAEICAGKAEWLRSVADLVSKDLGPGTGRVVQNLLIIPALSASAQDLESAERFVQRYSIQGMANDGLEVEHSVRFRLVDEDRWRAAKSPALKPLISERVAAATRLYLQDKHFEDAVALYLNLGGSMAKLDRAIGEDVARTVTPLGCELKSLSTALRIPHADFVHGRKLSFVEGRYHLSDAHVVATLTIQASVKLVLDDKHSGQFARAVAREPNLEASVVTAIDEQVREQLRRTSALAYYVSPYVNGVGTVQDPATGQWQSLSNQAELLHANLTEAVNTAIGARFGLRLDSFTLIPGSDALVERLRELSRLPIHHRVTLAFERGDADTQVKLHANASLFVASIDPDNWDSFLANARRLDTAEHKAAIGESLDHALALLEPTVVEGGAAALRSSLTKRKVVDWFIHQMKVEQGLVVLLRPLLLRVQRPGADASANLVRESLTRELDNVLAQREALIEPSTNLYSAPNEERAKLSRRIDEIRRELQAVAAEHEESLATAAAVVIEQQPGTGLLVNESDNQPVLPFGAC